MCRRDIIITMKKIPLTKGKITIVDDDDDEVLNKHKWLFLHRSAARAEHFRNESGERKQRWFHMHRVVANCPDSMEVDHINKNPLDNRKANLRICTHQQNSFNHPGYGHKGVHTAT